MDRVPRRSFCGDEVRSLVERRHFVAALIVSRGCAKMKDATHALEMIFTVYRDLRTADGLLEFVEHLAGKHGVRRQPQSQRFCVEISAGYDRGRELVVLVVGSADESALRAIERVLARGDVELEASVVTGDDGLHALPILRVRDGDAGARGRATSLPIDDRHADSVRAGWNRRPLRVRHLRTRGIEERHTARGDYDQASR